MGSCSSKVDQLPLAQWIEHLHASGFGARPPFLVGLERLPGTAALERTTGADARLGHGMLLHAAVLNSNTSQVGTPEKPFAMPPTR